MNRHLRLLALVGVLAVVAAACQAERAPEEEAEEGLSKGGTILAGLESDVDAAFDPQKEYYSVTWGFYHCCLMRTLVTTNGQEAENGGNELVPDLATDLPELSEDGLTYTFTIRDGVTFGPPFEDTEITSQSFINALEREADPKVGAGYGFYYSVIEGFDEFGEGEADSISGLNAVDDKTLEITLTRPSGDFPFRMMMPATGPIPDGAADGHEDDYGRFLVSSGPYMFEGSEAMDFSLPPEDQEPVAGYEPDRSIVFVRNPSWSEEVDGIRPAYPDRVEIQIGLTTEDMQNKIKAGELDLNLDGVPPAQIIQEYQNDPERSDQVGSFVGDGVYYLSMNVAEPPFDDVHVRRALNFALDKEGMLRIRGGPLFGEPASHYIIDSLLDNLLADFAPYGDPAGDIDAAKEEMSLSKYDSDKDGVCDAPECTGVVTATDEADPYPDQAALLSQNFGEVGIELDVTTFERTTMYDKCNDPGAHVAMCAGPGWFKDYSDATTFGEPLFGSVAIGPDSCCNYSNLGAPSDILDENGYEITEVPSVDADHEACDTLPIGDARFQCWADYDRRLTEEIANWVPINFAKDTFVWGDRILNFHYDQYSGQPNLGLMALAGGEA